MKPKFAVIRFPGTNRHREAVKTIESAGFDTFYFRWNDNFEKLREADAFLLPGGFSYEDRSRSGIMCALDPIMKVVREEAAKGKVVLGICNGAQMLIESGIVPGGVNNKTPMMCLANNVMKCGGNLLGTGFVNKWINMKLQVKPKRSAFTYAMKKDCKIKCPIAHGEGRYTTMDLELMDQLVENNQIVFRYCNENDQYIEDYPINPNGSLKNTAAIINPEGNVMAAMPHFEHFYDIGKPIFDSIYQYIVDGNSTNNLDNKTLIELKPFDEGNIEKFNSTKNNVEIFVKLIITDNEEESVNSTLNNIGFKEVSLSRCLHYELEHNFDEDNLIEKIESIIKSSELLNTNKESVNIKINNKSYHYVMDKGLIEAKESSFENTYLIREIDDYTGENNVITLRDRLGILGVQTIKRGIVWDFGKVSEENIKKVLDTRILHNPHAQIIYKY